MIKNILTLFALSIFLFSCNTEKDYTQFVDPFIGTGAHGHTYPGAQLPFGMVQLSPDTRNDESWDGCGGYHYSDPAILGFSHTHLSGTGVSDYGDILLLPISGEVNLKPGTRQNPESGYRSLFSHENEKASPGYYSVYLDDYKVKVELTASERVGFHRYIFDEAGEKTILLDLIHRDPVSESQITSVNKNRVEGFRRSKYWAGDQIIFFVMEFSKDFEALELFEDGKATTLNKGTKLQSLAKFTVEAQEKIEIKVAISTVSLRGARKNFNAEAKEVSFDTALNTAQKKWNKSLSKIEVEGGSLKEKRNFYTALYHSLLCPNLAQDVDKNYRGMDNKIYKAKSHTHYTVFSLWDTFRTLHPLLNIVEPEINVDFAKTLIKKSQEFGELPMWELASNDTRCMIGYHAVSLIADAYAKKSGQFDLEEAYIEMKKTAMLDKRGLKAYRNLGYVPSNKSSQGVSKTLEYAYNDWCVAQVAKALNKEEDYIYFMNRSTSYTQIFDQSVGFMRGKTDQHKWVPNFDPTAVGYNYTEGNSYQYSLFIPHDMNGFCSILGGEKELDKWLDKCFNTEMQHDLGDDTDVTGLIGQYAHGNEPSHHMAYLYNHAKSPWKAQNMARRIMSELYDDTPEGICGNEDCGQMSAWYVMSAMGFYTVLPGSDIYEMGSPIFDKITINQDNGKTFEIIANNNKKDNHYIQSASLNSANFNKSYLLHKQITKGGKLVLEMGSKPKKSWGTREGYPLKAYNNTPMVHLNEASNYFINKFKVLMSCDDKQAEIYYTTDGSEPTESSNKYTNAFDLKKTTVLKMRAYSKGKVPSNIAERKIEKVVAQKFSSKELAPGLKYDFYQGIYRSVYDYKQDKPSKSGITSVPNLDICLRNEWIGLDFKGLINIPRDGEYVFYISANDGCQLLINGPEQFESDGRKSVSFEQKSTIKLSAGYHNIEVKYYQCSDNIDLKVEWEGPNIKRQSIPSKVFYHLKH